MEAVGIVYRSMDYEAPDCLNFVIVWSSYRKYYITVDCSYIL